MMLKYIFIDIFFLLSLHEQIIYPIEIFAVLLTKRFFIFVQQFFFLFFCVDPIQTWAHIVRFNPTLWNSQMKIVNKIGEK